VIYRDVGGAKQGITPEQVKPTAGVGHRIRRTTEAAKGKYTGSSAEHLWRRLDPMDFINRGLGAEGGALPLER
jgi:hypothetical protein